MKQENIQTFNPVAIDFYSHPDVVEATSYRIPDENLWRRSKSQCGFDMQTHIGLYTEIPLS